MPGIVFGTIAGLICLFEFLLWPRKKLRIWRLGRVQDWMKGHIWLGLLSLPLAVMHSGFLYRGVLSTWLFVLFLVVIASGVVGLVLQQWLPRLLFREVPAETIHSQIGPQIERARAEARLLVDRACGESTQTGEGEWIDPADTTTHLVVGAIRTAGDVQGVVLERVAPPEPVPGAEPLRAFYRSSIDPFLTPGGARHAPLSEPRRSETAFRDLKLRLDPELHVVVDALASLCDQRRQWAIQERMHRWLHIWLCVHVPVSVVMMILLAAHVYYAIRYL